MVNLCLKSCKPMWFIFMLSIVMLPSHVSIIRNRARVKLLLPAPVRPKNTKIVFKFIPVVFIPKGYYQMPTKYNKMHTIRISKI